MDFNFLKDRYDFELERQEKLTNALTLPAGVLTGLVGGLSILAHNFSYEPRVLTPLFVVLLASDAIIGLVCLAFLGVAYHGREYEYLERLGILYRAEQEWFAWYAAIDGSAADAAKDFSDQLEQGMIKAADRNALSNDQRTGFLYQARVWLFMLLFFSTLTGLAYVADAVSRPKLIPEIRIENLRDVGR
jgi:hypothetical protein